MALSLVIKLILAGGLLSGLFFGAMEMFRFKGQESVVQVPLPQNQTNDLMTWIKTAPVDAINDMIFSGVVPFITWLADGLNYIIQTAVNLVPHPIFQTFRTPVWFSYFLMFALFVILIGQGFASLADKVYSASHLFLLFIFIVIAIFLIITIFTNFIPLPKI